MNPSCVEYDLSKIDTHLSTSTSGRWVSSLPCVRTASAGWPLGALNLPPIEKDVSGVIASCPDFDFAVDDEAAYQLVRRLFIGTTAPCFFIARGGQTIDARIDLANEWAPDQGIQRSNGSVRVDRLVTIKSAFGLSNSDMARICRISRPQLYKWLSEDQSVELTMPNWQRLAQLEQLAKEWNRLSARPLRAFLQVKVDSKNTILDLLSASRLNERKIRNAMRRFASMKLVTTATRDAKLRDAGIKSRKPVGALPWDD